MPALIRQPQAGCDYRVPQRKMAFSTLARMRATDDPSMP